MSRRHELRLSVAAALAASACGREDGGARPPDQAGSASAPVTSFRIVADRNRWNLRRVANVRLSRRRGWAAGDDPWRGYSLEWATSSSPPEHNFAALPRIRSERPALDRPRRSMGPSGGPGQ